MSRNLFQHMIEKAEARAHVDPTLMREIQVDGHVRFLGRPLDVRMTGGAENALRYPGPRFTFASVRQHAQALYSKIFGKFEIGIAVADHVATGLIHGIGEYEVLHHADVRLAASAAFVFVVWADENGRKFDALRSEQRHDELVRVMKLVAGQARRA